MKKFTLGMIAGASALALAVPLIAQVAGAASGSMSSAKRMPSVPTQACVQALTAKDDAYLSTIDALIAAEKSATQVHRDALAAAALADDMQRQSAVQKADTTFRTAMKAAQDTNASALKTAMSGVKTACGNAGAGFSGGKGKSGGFPKDEEGEGRKNGTVGMHREGKKPAKASSASSL